MQPVCENTMLGVSSDLSNSIEWQTCVVLLNSAWDRIRSIIEPVNPRIWSPGPNMLVVLVRGTESAGDPIRCDTGSTYIAHHMFIKKPDGNNCVKMFW